jgi:hypothetical protein
MPRAKFIVSLIGAIVLAVIMSCSTGCATLHADEADPAPTIVRQTCAAAIPTLDLLTAANEAGKITPSQKKIVTEAGRALLPVCGDPNPPTMGSVAQASFDAAARAIFGVAAEVSR